MIKLPKNYKYNKSMLDRLTRDLAKTDYLAIKYVEADIIIQAAKEELTAGNADAVTLSAEIAKYEAVKKEIRGKLKELLQREEQRERIRKVESDLINGI